MKFVIQTLATNPPGFLSGVEAGYIFHCDTALRNAQVFSDLAEAEAVAQSMDDGYGAVVESLGMIDVPLFHDRERAGLAEAKPKDRAILAAEIYSYVHEHLPERITCGYAGCLSPESTHDKPKDGALRRSNRCRCDPMLVVMAHVRVMVRVMVQMDNRLWLRVG